MVTAFLSVITYIQPAQASVAVDDLVYVQSPSGNYPAHFMHKSGSTTSQLTYPSLPDTDNSPDVSPDGSKIAFIGTRPNADDPNYSSSVLMVMNSDGSGQTTLVTPYTSPFESDSAPRWSPDGSRIAYIENTTSGSAVVVRDADGSNPDRLTTGILVQNVSWFRNSNGDRLVYDVFDFGTGKTQLYIMNADGTNQHLLAGSGTAYDESSPTWSPDGNRIYFISDRGFGVWYYSSTNGFTSGTPTGPTQLSSTDGPGTGVGGLRQVRVSADGSTLAFSNADLSGCNQIWTMSASSGAATMVTNTGCNSHNYGPTFVPASWPLASPSNSSVTVESPAASDAPYTRQITINLSTTGVGKFQYGWSQTNSTAPNTTYLQESTNLTTKKGPLNYLGKEVSGTWYGGTQPDQDWYLWVRTVQTGGTANAWATPLKVHTPKKPVWVAVGDSFSSGHNQLQDEFGCPTDEDFAYWSAYNCATTGAPHLTTEDPTFSWVNGAVLGFNSNGNVPSGWALEKHIHALSGRATSTFGETGATPGSNAWASGNTQAEMVRTLLYQRPDSWNIVSMTGGANDTNWTEKLREWYFTHFLSNGMPWAVTNEIYCPDTESVYNSLSSTVNASITSNLQGIVSVAVNASPGVRVLSVGYPHVVNSTNVCYADNNSSHGVASVIDALNANHLAVTGNNVKYVDLASDFGISPVTNSYLQLTRLYGYPHPSGTGQARIASKAQSVLTNW